MEDGAVTDYYPDKVAVNSVILVQPGEKIPLDGVVLTGSSSVNTAALTGESMPQPVESGSEVMSGTVNESGALTIRVTKPYGESTVAKILELVENASASKAAPERFITKFAAVYTPAVVIGAVVLAIVPPVLGFGAFTDWLYRALNFLVVSCPCALVISVPLSYFCAIGAASRKGVLVKGGVYMERLRRIRQDGDADGGQIHGTLPPSDRGCDGGDPSHRCRADGSPLEPPDRAVDPCGF